MNRRGFTLIEVLIAVSLTVLVIAGFYFLYNSLNIKYQTQLRLGDKSESANRIYRQLYNDIVSSSGFNTISSKDERRVLNLSNCTNTLHQMADANIAYVLNTQSHELFRVESLEKIPTDKEVSEEILDDSYIDLLSDNVEEFLVSGDESLSKGVVYIEYSDKTNDIFGFNIVK